jgi:biotin carboxylase
VWIVDSNEKHDNTLMVRLLRKLGTTIDVAGMSPDQAADALRPLQPDGIVAYNDAQIRLASLLAERLELDYYDDVVAQRLLDKPVQRRALQAGGLSVPHHVVVPACPEPGDLASWVAEVNFPVVVKPRHGAASRDTHLVRDATHLGEILAQLPAGPEPLMVVEEYMVGASPPPSQHFSDYVSVESAVVAGRISHVAVTGRLPPAEPFRETGLIIPSDFEPSVIKDLLRTATEAIAAIGILSGCLHTEIKVTDKGLRVIEVNGRLGGFVPPTLALAAPGVNLFEISQRVALGEDVDFPELVPTHHVGYVIVRQPPLTARRVRSVEGLNRVAAYPGVDAVSLSRPPGDEVDWRKGSHEYVFSVLGAAPDHESVRAVQQFIDDEVTVTYD